MTAAAEPLSIQPEVRPTLLAALAREELPTELHFVRSHFGAPAAEPSPWLLEINGAVDRARSWSLADLRRRPSRTQTVVLECAGHRRREFDPPTNGLQWGAGAVSEARWTGVPLATLLAEAVPAASACDVVFEGADHGVHPGVGGTVPFARAMPLERALAGDVLIAWDMNGGRIPHKHGAPIRVIVPGSYGVASVKWLRRISVVDHPFTGPFQTVDYQLDGEALLELRVASLILTPEPGNVPAGEVQVAGVAWGGREGIAEVEVRLAGERWIGATLRRPREPSGFTRWSSVLAVPPGRQVVEARARDRSGAVQPAVPKWNANGYANNSVHRIQISALPAGQ
jgi:DMSO/TMAO reductase YedYZ molybdopterin-dependent catalytic subunit